MAPNISPAEGRGRGPGLFASGGQSEGGQADIRGLTTGPGSHWSPGAMEVGLRHHLSKYSTLLSLIIWYLGLALDRKCFPFQGSAGVLTRVQALHSRLLCTRKSLCFCNKLRRVYLWFMALTSCIFSKTKKI